MVVTLVGRVVRLVELLVTCVHLSHPVIAELVRMVPERLDDG
jgi:hypothetical protein